MRFPHLGLSLVTSFFGKTWGFSQVTPRMPYGKVAYVKVDPLKILGKPIGMILPPIVVIVTGHFQGKLDLNNCGLIFVRKVCYLSGNPFSQEQWDW